MNAFAVVSDSGTLPEESSFFTSVGHPFPAVCIRTSTERPEAPDKAGFILAGIDEVSLLQAVDTAEAVGEGCGCRRVPQLQSYIFPSESASNDGRSRDPVCDPKGLRFCSVLPEADGTADGGCGFPGPQV